MTKLSDSWRTPDWLFEQLNEEFNFDIDLCASRNNSKTNHFSCDYLNDLTGSLDSNCIGTLREDVASGKVKTAFMNPPYSNPRPFIEKAWEDSKHCKIVCLVKCDPSTQWWATFWDYNKCSCNPPWIICAKINCNNGNIGPKPGCEVRFFPKRIQFDPPQELVEKGSVKLIKGRWHVLRYAGGSTADPRTIKFDDTVDWERLSGPTFPCALLIFDRRGL